MKRGEGLKNRAIRFNAYDVQLIRELIVNASQKKKNKNGYNRLVIIIKQIITITEIKQY